MDESAAWWAGSCVVVAAIVVPYFLAFRRRVRRDRERKHEAARLGIDRPLAQYPHVDALRCIGCAACVDACPEGDVLGVVGGTATVVNGLRCVGHAACGEACPVGAIEVGLGDVKARADVPLLDERHETTLPGVYVVGELGGLALIRNAVEQGRRVGDLVAAATRSSAGAGPGVHDVVVVGAGPAGLSAAIAAAERGLTPLVLEQESDLGGSVLHYPRRKLVLVQEVALPLGGRLAGGEHSKESLLELLEGLLGRARLDVRFGERLESLRREDGTLVLETSGGRHQARAVILALGRRGTPRRLGVPGEERSKVMYRLLDAESYRGQRILVVGGGDSAVEAAIGLARQRGNEVTLSYRRERLVRIKRRNQERIDRLLGEGRVKGLMPSRVERIGERTVTLAGSDGPVEIGNDFVFVFAGGDPPFELLRRAGVRFGGDDARASTPPPG